MFDNPLLDITIGLAFFYALLSILVTVVQEGIASSLDWRAKNLQAALAELLLVPRGSAADKNRADSDKETLGQFFADPEIFPLFRGGLQDSGTPKAGPSYIPARSFAAAVIRLWDQAQAQASQTQTQAGMTGNTSAPAFAIAQRLLAGAASATTGTVPQPPTKDQIEDAIKALSSLFDSTMDRSIGWYKRKTKLFTLLISIAVAAGLNADSIYIAGRLWGDQTLRSQIVETAQKYVEASLAKATENCGPLQKQGSGQDHVPDNIQQTGTSTPAGPGQGTAPVDPAAGNSAEGQNAASEALCWATAAQGAIAQVETIGFPIHWTNDAKNYYLQPGQNPLYAILGILMTGFAISLGSSFWFDVLGRLMKLRGAGQREETEEEKGNKQKTKT